MRIRENGWKQRQFFLQDPTSGDLLYNITVLNLERNDAGLMSFYNKIRFPNPTKLLTEPSKLFVRISSLDESAYAKPLSELKAALVPVRAKQTYEFSCYDS